MTKGFINEALNCLSKNRPIFHSEDDFKFALAWKLKEKNPNIEIRLEYKANNEDITYIDRHGLERNAVSTIDILIIEDGCLYPIELKYKQKRMEITFNDEHFNLTEHSAHPDNRYLFRKDIYRVEQFVKNHGKSKKGFVIFLTNDVNYQNDISNTLQLSSFYSMHNAIIPLNDPGWNYQDIESYQFNQISSKWINNNNKVHWTCKNELFDVLNLTKNYQIEWSLYSSFNENREFFHYILLEI